RQRLVEQPDERPAGARERLRDRGARGAERVRVDVLPRPDAGGHETRRLELAVEVEEKSLALLAAQVAALAELREPPAELLLDDPCAVAAERLRDGKRESVGLDLSRERDLDVRHRSAMLARRRIISPRDPYKELPMGQTTQEFFDSLASRADTSQTAGMNNSYAFDIEGAGQWTVTVTDGAVAVADGMADGADCTISTSQEVFDKIVAGEQNPTSAYMTGKLKLKGDMGAAMKLQKLFPS